MNRRLKPDNFTALGDAIEYSVKSSKPCTTTLFPSAKRYIASIFALTLALTTSSWVVWQAVAEARTITLTMKFFSTKRQVIGEGKFSYDNSQPYQTLHGVEYFPISDFEATFENQTWS